MKKLLWLFLPFVIICTVFCGCEEEIIEKPTIVIDETIGQEESSEIDLGIDIETNDSSVVVDSNNTTEEVDLSDSGVILGKWEIVSHLVDDVEETPETKYLVITEDYKFYLTNSLKSLAGDYKYSYKDAVITVTLNNQLDETYDVTMESKDKLTLKYVASEKVYVDTYKKVQ